MSVRQIRVRLATNGDCALLPLIELSAGRRFAEIGMDDVSSEPPPDAAAWEPHCASSNLWVSVDDQDRPFGFLAAGVHGHLLFIYQLAVAYDRQRQGVGHALLSAAEAAAQALGLHEVFLTTFCDVPFNGPYYERQGYRIVEDADLPAALLPVMDAERRRWTTPSRRRCAMRKRV